MVHRLLLLDGHAYAYRAFHAIKRLTGPDGRPTNAIFGFVQMWTRLVAALDPSHVCVVWDGGLSRERQAALPEYKAQRPPMPDALAAQLDEIGAYLAAAGIAAFCQDGVEADDYIALAARRAVAAGLPVVIASSDKDFMQLVSANIGLVNPGDSTPAVWSDDRVREKTGVAPGQIVDWLSLVGDSVDNIAGVPGVGPKTAAKLLQQFGSADALYRQLASVAPESLRGRLAAAEPVMRRNQALIRLRDDLPCDCDVATLERRAADTARLRTLYQGWGFRRLAASVAAPETDGLLPGMS